METETVKLTLPVGQRNHIQGLDTTCNIGRIWRL